MKRALPFALLALALPTVAFATPLYTTGDFARGTSSGFIATSVDLAVTGSLAGMAIDRSALHFTPNPRALPGSAPPRALFLLIPAAPPNAFADNLPLEIAKVTVEFPEPGALGLLGIGLIGLATIVRWTMRGRNPAKGIITLQDEGQETTRASTGWETAARAASELKVG